MQIQGLTTESQIKKRKDRLMDPKLSILIYNIRI